MELINILISNAVSILIGLGGAILFYRSRRRKESAEATGAEAQAQGLLLAQYETFIDTLNGENKSLKLEIADLRTEARGARSQEAKERERVVAAYKERSDALVDLEILRGKFTLAEWNKCDQLNCNKRKPPRTEQQIIENQ
ncbi:MAG: hypothetical protein RR277_08055 [Rikenellaceae bacterium]